MTTAAILLAPLMLFLPMCSGGSNTAACAPVRGDETTPVSVWSCADDAAAGALRAQHDFTICARQRGEARLYECHR